MRESFEDHEGITPPPGMFVRVVLYSILFFLTRCRRCIAIERCRFRTQPFSVFSFLSDNTQVGGAKVAGINFSAKTTLEVREWPTGMPDFAHFQDEMWEGRSREDRASEYPKIKLKRYQFPRPFAVSNLPTRDISMQSIENDGGEFRLYQGVWRMQPLVGRSPPGKNAMRLTYAVEISPRVYLPVKLIEGRIVRDLCSNLEAIREAVSVGVE